MVERKVKSAFIVQSDPVIREVILNILVQSGISSESIMSASSYSDSIATIDQLRQQDRSPDIYFVNLSLKNDDPNDVRDGTGVMAYIRETDTQTPIVLTTGNPEINRSGIEKLFSPCIVLLKPFDKEPIKKALTYPYD